MDIAAHPKFRADNRSALDSRTLRELETLGGRDFVVELSQAFLQEGARILTELQDAVALRDVLAFHDRLHALRSGAANLGALSLYDICLGLRAISDSEFQSNGREQLGRVRAEFARVENALIDYEQDEADGQAAVQLATVTKLQRKAPA